MIRTYVRKRPKYCFIDDAKERCRLCLEKCEEPISIFTQDSQISALALRITICIGLELTKEECLSNIICKECFKEVEVYYSFRKKCELTYQKLKSHVLAYNERLANNANNKIVANETKPIIKGEEKSLSLLKQHSPNALKQNDLKDQTQQLCSKDKNENLPVHKAISPEAHKEIVAKPEPPFKSPEFSSFLAKMLVKLGVLSHENNSLEISEPTMSTIHLEMGDGSQMTLELREEDSGAEEPSTNNTDAAVTNQVAQVPTEHNIVNHDKYVNAPMKMLTIKPMLETAITKEQSNGFDEFECKTCNKVYCSRGVLNRHRRSHTGERPFTCRACGRGFTTKTLLQRHELVHDEQRPFSCTQCPKSFTQAPALEAHEKSHVEPTMRPLTLFPCNLCDKLFMHRSGLTRHTRWHEGLVNICNHCSRGFRDTTSLKRHLKICSHRPIERTPETPIEDPPSTEV